MFSAGSQIRISRMGLRPPSPTTHARQATTAPSAPFFFAPTRISRMFSAVSQTCFQHKNVFPVFNYQRRFRPDIADEATNRQTGHRGWK